MASQLSSLGDVLTICARDWAGRFRARLAGEWDATQVEQLHEELDRLAVDSDAAGKTALSHAAVELSAFLCSFVGAGRGPDAAQRAQLEALEASLLAAAAAPVAPQKALPAKPASLLAVEHLLARASAVNELERHVLCVTEDAGLVAALSVALTERGIALTARSPGMSPSAYVPEFGVQCVIVDAGAIGVLGSLERNAAAMSGRASTRPTFVALIDGPDTAARMRAMRAGADHVVAYTGDCDALVARLAEILVARSEEPLKVLLIDDDRSHTAFCESILRRFGMETIVCAEPARATELFAERKPDVVLLDLYMPGVDGLAISESLLELPGSEHTSILFLSGDAEPETRFDALAAGGDDFLSKPIAPRHLIRAVAAHGRRAQRRRRLSLPAQ